ncbi:hypothetical protein HPB52_019865 [Rhipicephalus sanguineus]|uniref:Uncharacterized protein n=1 Tax=Rhipicephalus sanguineus TaxID=34632 RepID=A0A9D4Q2F1_RHISA|nr:hypothetical protein HPB52_019865 [Rhipicephalus sanguineus]
MKRTGWSRILDSTTEWLWQLTLQQLRACLPKKTPVARTIVHTVGNVQISDKVSKVLSQVPKFTVQPKKSALDQLAMVKKFGSYAPDTETDRCVSEGVDVLERTAAPVDTFDLNGTVTYLRNNSLFLVPAD